MMTALVTEAIGDCPTKPSLVKTSFFLSIFEVLTKKGFVDGPKTPITVFCLPFRSPAKGPHVPT